MVATMVAVVLTTGLIAVTTDVPAWRGRVVRA